MTQAQVHFQNIHRSEDQQMAATMTKQAVGHTRAKIEEKVEFQLIFVVALVLFLVAALVELVLPRQWRDGASAQGAAKPFFQGVVASARTASKFAFMG